MWALEFLQVIKDDPMGSVLTKKADFVNLDALICSVVDFLEANSIKSETISEIHLAVEEILVNICSYAYPESYKGDVTIKSELVNDRENVVITFIDSGIPFDTAFASLPSLNTPISSRSIGGLGIHMVRRLMDKVAYKRENNNNILILEKRISC